MSVFQWEMGRGDLQVMSPVIAKTFSNKIKEKLWTEKSDRIGTALVFAQLRSSPSFSVAL